MTSDERNPKESSGLDSVCPTGRRRLSTKRKKRNGQTTIGNGLRAVGGVPSGAPLPAPVDPRPVVVRADAAGRRSDLGMGAHATARHPTGRAGAPPPARTHLMLHAPDAPR